MDSYAQSCLQSDNEYIFFALNSTKRCVPVIHKPSSEKPKLSTKTTHFCILFSPDQIPLLSLEVYTYLSFYKFGEDESVERLIYVGKADTTGLAGSGMVNVGSFVSSYLKSIANIPIEELLNQVKISESLSKNGLGECFLSDSVDVSAAIDGPLFLSETQKKLFLMGDKTTNSSKSAIETKGGCNGVEYLKNNKRFSKNRLLDNSNVPTRLVMFTRSEGQYIFPESMKNEDKHVLDGTKLLKWWLKNIETVCAHWNACEKYLNILNMDDREIQRYFPSNGEKWNVGSVYNAESDSKIRHAIYNIPLLPDDPKGRFLEHVVVEGRAKKLSCKRFWQELAIRQEFRFGVVVGLIGVEGKVPTLNQSTGKRNHVSSKKLKKFIELVTSKDYSEKTDWILLFTEISNLLFVNPKCFKGEWNGRKIHDPNLVIDNNKANRELSTAKVNTLMCVRSRKKIKLETSR